MKAKKVAAFTLAVVMGVSVLSGCKAKNVDADEIVAKMDDNQEVRLGVANFMARYTQSTYDSFYVSYFGEDYWGKDMSGKGETLEKSTKDQILETLKTYYALAAHTEDYGVTISEEDTAAMEKAAKAFIKANSKEAIAAMSANEEDIVEYLRLITIQKRMQEAIEKDVDTNVSDDEAAQRTYSYVQIPTTGTADENGETKKLTDEEVTALYVKAQGIVSGKADEFDSKAEEAGYTVETQSYGKDDTPEDSGIPEDVIAAANGLKEGQMSEVIDTGSALYVLRLDSEFDQQATDTKKESIIEERKSELYDEVCQKYLKDFKFDVDKKVWKKVKFEDLFSVKQPETQEDTNTSGEETTLQ